MNHRKHALSAITTMDGKMHWHIHNTPAWHEEEEGFHLEFPTHGARSEEGAEKELASRLQHNRVTWLAKTRGTWTLDLDSMRHTFRSTPNLSWLRGIIHLRPKITLTEENSYLIVFKLTEAFMNEIAPKKIFLSHKGIDKTVVRTYHGILKELGFEPWLDEDAMPVGANLERALLQGMKDSCAAIFFLTENYRDEGYLATEIEYAIQEKRRKGDRFALITLNLSKGEAKVPDLLAGYVWRSPQTEFAALTEIIRALPLVLPPPQWK